MAPSHISSQLTWLLIKDYNSFQRKNLNGVIMSAEPGNIASKHSYKYSGLANDKTLHIAHHPSGKISVTKPRDKNYNKPKDRTHASHSSKQFPKLASSVKKEAQQHRPDLQKAALARLSAVHKSSLAKKRTSSK